MGHQSDRNIVIFTYTPRIDGWGYNLGGNETSVRRRYSDNNDVQHTSRRIKMNACAQSIEQIRQRATQERVTIVCHANEGAQQNQG